MIKIGQIIQNLEDEAIYEVLHLHIGTSLIQVKLIHPGNTPCLIGEIGFIKPPINHKIITKQKLHKFLINLNKQYCDMCKTSHAPTMKLEQSKYFFISICKKCTLKTLNKFPKEQLQKEISRELDLK